ncbi:MAG: 7,8-didemethyl-8-hydroxy-5-deazariboflavin synthase subunit CofG [Promethearchaeota archaeon]
MKFQEDFKKFKTLTLKQIKEKVIDIKAQLPSHKQKVITYSKNFTLSLSNYCQNQCGYCFYNYNVPKMNNEKNLVLLDNEKIYNLIEKALRFNCKEALIMSGEKPDNFQEVRNELKKRNYNTFFEFVKDICNLLLISNLLPHINIGLLTYNELRELKSKNASMGLMLESTNPDLIKKGGVHEHSPSKTPKKRIKHITNAGKLKIPFTTGLLIGIGENLEDRIRDLYLIKEINEKYGHIQEVIIQNFIYKKRIPYRPRVAVTVKDILKIIGIAKIILENDIAVQVAPNLISGYEKSIIDMGIDDFGGISPITIDYINPENKWPQIEDLRKICKSNGYKLKERLPIYEKFISKNGFCPESIKKVINNINLNNA